MQDSLKGITGQVRLMQHKVSRFGLFVLKVLDLFRAENLRQMYVQRFGVLMLDTGFIKNTITNASFAVLSGLAGNTGAQTAFTYLAVGTSNTAASASQTALGGEIVDSGLQRAAATVSRVTTTQTNDTLQLSKAFTVTGTKTVEEIGIFNASSSGTMLGRALTGTQSLVNGSVITLVYKVKFA